MDESDFWNNLDNFVDRENKKGSKSGDEKVGSWLKNIPESQNTKDEESGAKSNSPGKSSTSPRSTPNTEGKTKKHNVTIKEGKVGKSKREKHSKDDKKVFSTKKFIKKSKLRRRKRTRRHEPLYFGPQVECNFNLPKVAATLEKLMGSSVVHLIDRKYMLELQKRLNEHYKDLLSKRIAKRQMAERERSKRLGNGGTENPVFMQILSSDNLILKKREKLKTIREKNAERLIKQGKRWERERLIMEEHERLKEIAAKKDRERMLEEQTLYVFDSENIDTEAFKVKNRKLTDCEIDVKDFLLSERSEVKKRMLEKEFSSQDSTGDRNKKSNSSMEDNRVKSVRNESIPEEGAIFKPRKSIQPELDEATLADIKRVEEMKKKTQSKKDEDPRLTKFKEAETVKDIYNLAEDIIAGDDEAGRKKLW